MISYKEEYFKLFAKEKIFSSSSFKCLKDNLNTVIFYGPYQNQEEQGFIKDTKNILDLITSIIKKPQVTVTSEDVIVRSDQATNIDAASFLETMQDSSLWKRKNSSMSPENIHVKVASDTYVLYENIFITKVLSFINDELLNISKNYERKIKNLSSYFETEKVTYSKYGVLSFLANATKPISNVLYQENEENFYDLEALNKLLKKCSSLMSTPFYKENSNAKSRRKEIVMTNILLKDRRYFNCYKFYKNYFSSKNNSYLLPLYQDYVFLRILNVLNENYSMTDSLNKDLSLSYDKHLSLTKPITAQDKYFTYSLEKDVVENGIIISVSQKKDNSNSSKNYILLSLEVNNENYTELKEKMSQKKAEGYSNVTLITLCNNTYHHNHIFTCSFYKDEDTIDAIKTLLSSYGLLFDCSTTIYEHNCPLCGKVNIHNNEANYSCSFCKSEWTNITLNNKKYLWIKGIGGK